MPRVLGWSWGWGCFLWARYPCRVQGSGFRVEGDSGTLSTLGCRSWHHTAPHQCVDCGLAKHTGSAPTFAGGVWGPAPSCKLLTQRRRTTHSACKSKTASPVPRVKNVSTQSQPCSRKSCASLNPVVARPQGGSRVKGAASVRRLIRWERASERESESERKREREGGRDRARD